MKWLVMLALCAGCTSPYPNIVMPSVPDPPPPVPRVAARLYLLVQPAGRTLSVSANVITTDGRGVPNIPIRWTVSAGQLLVFRDLTDGFGIATAALRDVTGPVMIAAWSADGTVSDRITVP